MMSGRTRRWGRSWLCRGGVLAGAVLLWACSGAASSLTWEKVERAIRRRFPDVPQISTRQLAARLADPAAVRPVLLDARAPEEHAVSHLQGARQAETPEQALAALEHEGKDRPVVVYCSVGYRSAALVRDLRARGYTNAVNLSGSIFAWANEGRPLFRGERAVRAVHPYDEKWGALLGRELWATSAPTAFPAPDPR